MADSDTTARGLLMLRPIPTFFMEDILDTPDLDTPDTSDTMAMDSDTPTARGLLMLSLRLRLILTTDTVLDTDTALDTPDILDTMADSDTTARGLLMLRPSLPSLWRTPWIRRTSRILWRTQIP